MVWVWCGAVWVVAIETMGVPPCWLDLRARRDRGGLVAGWVGGEEVDQDGGEGVGGDDVCLALQGAVLGVGDGVCQEFGCGLHEGVALAAGHDECGDSYSGGALGGDGC